MRADLVTGSYKTVEQKPDIWLFARDINRERVRIRKRDVHPWFYVRSVNPTDRKDIFGNFIKRIEYQRPQQTRELKKGYEHTYRTQIPFVYNYLSSIGVRCGMEVGKDIVPAPDLGIPPRIGMYDFEMTSPPEIVPRPEDPQWPIVMMQWMDSYTSEAGVSILENEKAKKVDYPWVKYFTSEVDMYEDFFRTVNHQFEWDGLMGHFGNKYDLPYLYERGRKFLHFNTSGLSPLGAFFVNRNPKTGDIQDVTIAGMEALDSLEMYADLTKPEGRKRYGFDLKLIVQNECDFWYTDYGDQVNTLWESDHETLAQYGRNDVIALQKMDQKRNLIPWFDNIRRILGCPLQWSTQNLKFIHLWLTRVSDMLGVELPTFDLSAPAEHYSGATVQDGSAIRGFYDNIAVFDLKSLYPSIIVNLNLSFETKSIQGTEVTFSRHPEGILPNAVKRLMDEREIIRKMRRGLPAGSEEFLVLYYRDQAFKYAVNSFYGAMKHFDEDIARETTKTGRWLITTLIHDLERDLGLKVRYWDTDSLFVQMKNSNWQLGTTIESVLQQKLRELEAQIEAVRPFEIRYEKFYKRLMIHASKHYVGQVIMEEMEAVDNLEIKGVAAKKSDSAVLSMEVQTEIFDAIVKEGDIQKAKRIVRDAWEGFEKQSWAKIFIPKGFTKDFDEYEKKGAWIKGAENSVKLFGKRFRQDHKLQLLYVVPTSRVKGFDELCFFANDTAEMYPQVRVDYKKMREKVLTKKIAPFMELAGVDWSEITKGLKQTRLGEQ